MTPKVFQHEKCDAVFDRGAFEAILECDRSDYVKIILPLLANDFKYILSICDYEDETFVGSVGCRQEVKKLFNGHEVAKSVRTVVELLEVSIRLSRVAVYYIRNRRNRKQRSTKTQVEPV